MSGDPLDILRTHECATPGPWTADDDAWWQVRGACNDVADMWPDVTNGPEGFAAEANVRHVLTWDPDTTREIVEVLAALVYPIVDDYDGVGGPNRPYCGHCGAEIGECDPEDCERQRLENLLARVRERMGE